MWEVITKTDFHKLWSGCKVSILFQQETMNMMCHYSARVHHTFRKSYSIGEQWQVSLVRDVEFPLQWELSFCQQNKATFHITIECHSELSVMV